MDLAHNDAADLSNGQECGKKAGLQRLATSFVGIQRCRPTVTSDAAASGASRAIDLRPTRRRPWRAEAAILGAMALVDAANRVLDWNGETERNCLVTKLGKPFKDRVARDISERWDALIDDGCVLDDKRLRPEVIRRYLDRLAVLDNGTNRYVDKNPKAPRFQRGHSRKGNWGIWLTPFLVVPNNVNRCNSTV